MPRSAVHNINVESQKLLVTPAALKSIVPISEANIGFVLDARQRINDILDRKDQRLLVVVGPCSIHDTDAAMEYAFKLRALAKEVDDALYIVMRVYFEKPRTTTGWKGLINDPHLNDSFDIETGLVKGRTLLRDLIDLGLPTGTEALDPITPQYLQDLICWSAIGARTTESQTHREMASGLSSAVGFKNGTDGGLKVAINALKSVMHPHRFLGINSEGVVSIFETRGNPYAHVVLRGGNKGPNYDSVHIKLCEHQLRKAGLAINIMVDCNHANSGKNPSLQPLIADDVASQICEGNRSVIGLMIESNLYGGNQPAAQKASELKYGVSITDSCLSWEETEKMIRGLQGKLSKILPLRPSLD